MMDDHVFGMTNEALMIFKCINRRLNFDEYIEILMVLNTMVKCPSSLNNTKEYKMGNIHNYDNIYKMWDFRQKFYNCEIYKLRSLITGKLVSIEIIFKEWWFFAKPILDKYGFEYDLLIDGVRITNRTI